MRFVFRKAFAKRALKKGVIRDSYTTYTYAHIGTVSSAQEAQPSDDRKQPLTMETAV